MSTNRREERSNAAYQDQIRDLGLAELPAEKVAGYYTVSLPPQGAFSHWHSQADRDANGKDFFASLGGCHCSRCSTEAYWLEYENQQHQYNNLEMK